VLKVRGITVSQTGKYADVDSVLKMTEAGSTTPSEFKITRQNMNYHIPRGPGWLAISVGCNESDWR
jgi:hypothetical protein